MDPKARTPIPRQILEEASAWFVDFRVGDADSSARERFERWLRQSPQHIQAYLEVAATYADLPAVKSSIPLDVPSIMARVRVDRGAEVVSIARATDAQPSHRAFARSPLVAASLAALLTVAGVSSWLAWENRGIYSTGIGEERSIALADGSVVDLNANSRIRVRYDRTERRVELVRGQALFLDTEDLARPFVVQSGGTYVRAVGTQFDVNREVTQTVVTVLQGRVAVVATRQSREGEDPSADEAPAVHDALPRTSGGRSRAVRPVLVAAGEQIAISDGVARNAHPADVSAAIAWRRHQLIFDGSPLIDVVSEFNRYNTRQLVIKSPAINNLKISGVYSSTDPGSFVRFLRAQPGVTVVESNGQIQIEQD